MTRSIAALAAAAAFIFVAGPAFAAHPLITDDTGTQGKGRYQLEVNGGFGRDRESVGGTVTRTVSAEAATIVSAGVVDPVDLVVTLPFAWSRITDNGIRTGSDAGISDLTVEAKWRFLETERFTAALKPGVAFPTGDESRGLGNGRVSFGGSLITSVRFDPVNLHLNLACWRNDFRLAADRENLRRTIVRASAAATVEIARGWQLAADLGTETNPDRRDGTWVSWIVGGVIWSLSESVDLDLGIRGGITRPATDLAGVGGITLRF